MNDFILTASQMLRPVGLQVVVVLFLGLLVKPGMQKKFPEDPETGRRDPDYGILMNAITFGTSLIFAVAGMWVQQGTLTGETLLSAFLVAVSGAALAIGLYEPGKNSLRMIQKHFFSPDGE